MRKKKLTAGQRMVYVIFGWLLVMWLGVLFAPCLKAGDLFAITEALNASVENPFSLSWHENTKQVLIALSGAYALAVLYFFADEKNYRRGEEHGSAEWTSPYAINKKIAEKQFFNNRILSENVGISYNVKRRKHRCNLNTIVVGGSGAGKTRFYVKPNLMQCNTSFVILDPKGENLASCGALLKNEGYEIKVLNLIDMEQSDHFNPFVYLTDDNSVQTMVTNIFKATSDGAPGGDSVFWEESAKNLLSALCYYLKYKAIPEDQTFSNVMLLLRCAEVREDDENYKSEVDMMFEALEEEDPSNIALKYWKLFRRGAGKTIKSIQQVLASHLQAFNLTSLEELTSKDDLELWTLGDKKTALFLVIPDLDKSFNFLVSILYFELFQILEKVADSSPGKHLKIPVHFLMDEFHNVEVPKDFENVISVIRSRWISVSIILQNVSQLKADFEKEWESIIGNCDTFIYLGGNEQSTHEYIAKKLGTETIDTNTYGQQRGSRGNSSVNYQNAGRELLNSQEVANLPEDEAIIFVRGKAILDKKYSIEKHPRYKLLGEEDETENRAYIHSKPVREDELTVEYVPPAEISVSFLPDGLRLMTAKEATSLYPNVGVVDIDNEIAKIEEELLNSKTQVFLREYDFK